MSVSELKVLTDKCADIIVLESPRGDKINIELSNGKICRKRNHRNEIIFHYILSTFSQLSIVFSLYIIRKIYNFSEAFITHLN